MNIIPREILCLILDEVHPYYCKLHMTNKYFRDECHILRYYVLRRWCTIKGKQHEPELLSNIHFEDVRFASLFYCPIMESNDKFSPYSLFYNYHANVYYSCSRVPIYIWITNSIRKFFKGHPTMFSLHNMLSTIFVVYSYSNAYALASYISKLQNLSTENSHIYHLIHYIGVILGIAKPNLNDILTEFNAIIVINFMFNNLTLTPQQIVSIILRMRELHPFSIRITGITDRLQGKYNLQHVNLEEYNSYHRETSLVLGREGSHGNFDIEEINKLLLSSGLEGTYKLKPFRTSFSSCWRYNVCRIQEDKIPLFLKGIYYIMRGNYIQYLNYKRIGCYTHESNEYYDEFGDRHVWLVSDDNGNICYTRNYADKITICSYLIDISNPKVTPWNIHTDVIYKGRLIDYIDCIEDW